MDCIYFDNNKSVSKVEYITNANLAPRNCIENDTYRLSLNTNKTPIFMYATKNQCKYIFVSSFINCMKARSNAKFTLVNNVLHDERYMYKIDGYIKSPLKSWFTNYKIKLNIKYIPLLKDGKVNAIKIKYDIKYNIFLLWYKTKIQPKEIILSIDEVEDVIYLISGILHIN